MAWQPPPKPPEPLWKKLVSRGALLILGLMLDYGGYACLRAAHRFSEDYRTRFGALPGRRDDGSGLALMAGIILLIVGIFITVAAITPTSIFEKLPFFSYDAKDLDKDPSSSWWSWIQWW